MKTGRNSTTIIRNKTYSESYRRDTFYLWYDLGKPAIRTLLLHLPPDENGTVPSIVTVKNWPSQDNWREKAEELDQRVIKALNQKAVQIKVEMAERHREIAKKIQTKALYTLDQADQLESEHAAIRLLELGLSLERESVGVDRMYEQARKMSDGEVLESLKELMRIEGLDLDELDDQIPEIESRSET